MDKNKRLARRRTGRTRPESVALSKRPHGGRAGRWYLIVFCLALLFRLIHIISMHDTVLFSVLLGDSREYDRWAQDVAAGNWIGREVFYQAPFYPYFLAFLYKVLGHNLMGVRVIQTLIGSGSCVLLAMAGRRFFSLRVGVVAGVILAVYPPAIFFDAIIQKTCVSLFFMTLLLWVLARITEKPAWSCSLAAGLVLGCFALIREHALLLVPVVVVWLLFDSRHASRRSRITHAGILSLGLSVILLPVAVRNHAMGGRFQLTTSQFGSNFYIGNNAGADGSYKPLRPWRGDAQFERSDAVQIAESDMGRKLTPAEVSSYWFRRAVDYIRSKPVDWLGLMFKKTYLLAGARELDDTESIRAREEWSPVLWAPHYFLHFGTLVPLAAVGLWVTRALWRHVFVLYLVAGAYVASIVLFFVLAQYRAPLIPLAALFASAGITEFAWRFRGTHLRDRVICAVLLLASGVVVNYPQKHRRFPVALTYANVGAALVAEGKHLEATRWFQDAVDRNPLLEAGYCGIAGAAEEMGQLELAIRNYRRALELRPDYADAHHGLAYALQRNGDMEDAAKHYERTLELDPTRIEAYLSLGLVLGRLGRSDASMRCYRKAIEINPDFEDGHYNLGVVLARAGRFEDAIVHLESVASINPRNVAGRHHLARVLARLDRFEEAERHFTFALELQPENANLHADFGQVLAAERRFAEARQHLETAVRINPDHDTARNTLAQVLRAQARSRDE